MDWPKRFIFWLDGRTMNVSIPFTWELEAAKNFILSARMLWDRAFVGGPAVDLMPIFFEEVEGVEVGGNAPGVLQRVNSMSTRTTTGCTRKCGFCGIGQGKIEAGGFRELEDWPDLPILVDNNLLAASQGHFDRVMDRLESSWGWADFTQGLDSRLLNEHHAERLARLKGPKTKVRLALDSMAYADGWEDAFSILRRAGVPKSHIRSYALVGFRDTPDEAWERCQWVEGHGVKVLPMWFHPLDALQKNVVTPAQASLGWDDVERKRIMQWFYQHKAFHGGPRMPAMAASQ